MEGYKPLRPCIMAGYRPSNPLIRKKWKIISIVNLKKSALSLYLLLKVYVMVGHLLKKKLFHTERKKLFKNTKKTSYLLKIFKNNRFNSNFIPHKKNKFYFKFKLLKKTISNSHL